MFLCDLRDEELAVRPAERPAAEVAAREIARQIAGARARPDTELAPASADAVCSGHWAVTSLLEWRPLRSPVARYTNGNVMRP